jgi:hypothetical protein
MIPIPRFRESASSVFPRNSHLSAKFRGIVPSVPGFLQGLPHPVAEIFDGVYFVSRSSAIKKIEQLHR